VITSTSAKAPPKRRRRLQKKQTATASPVVGRRCKPCHSTLACAPTAIVSCVVTAAPEGVTVAGLNEQVAFAGNPEQAKLTVELNPFIGVIVRVVDPCEPELTVSDVGEAVKVNVGGGSIIV
jgi:hypothetical protein